MKLFGADTDSGMIRKISDCFGMNFNPKLSPGYRQALNNPRTSNSDLKIDSRLNLPVDVVARQYILV